MQSELRKLVFPRIREITLVKFSLFTFKGDTLTIKVNEGVLCLAGANGIGKSTFLCALNFALTGRVPEPGRKFTEASSYYIESEPFVAQYFKGRITESDRDHATISVIMDVGERTYELCRSLFEPDGLRHLTIYRRGTGKKKNVVEVETEGLDNTERNDIYEREIAHDVGLALFDQFVFLQHFVFTFDERRRLLFWEDKELEQALYLAFGVSSNDAKRAGTIRREIEKSDSLVRNLKWQHTELTKRVAELKGAAPVEDDIELRRRYDGLQRHIDKSRESARSIETQLRDQTLTLTDLATQQIGLKAEYDEVFHTRLRSRVNLRNHPLAVSSNEQGKCGLCGNENKHALATLNTRIQSSSCPLCASAVPTSPEKSSESMNRLAALDRALMQVGAKVQDAVKTMSRLRTELRAAQEKEQKALEKLERFEGANFEQISAIKVNADSGLKKHIESYEKRLSELESKRQAQLTRREENKKELKKLRSRMVEKYHAAEAVFVPSLKKLAEQFLGLDLKVRISEGGNASVGLALEIRGTPRREHIQLSESQRFFIDIALRMALAQYMSSPQNQATLFIDTPEGSLDIAYENRAGVMIATYARTGHPIIMTANINTSRLLQVLAEELGGSRMALCRMTDWAELSDVQRAEEKLFSAAYRQIEDRLSKPQKLSSIA